MVKESAKKLFVGVSLIFILLFFVSCSGKSTDATTSSVPTSSSTTGVMKPAPGGGIPAPTGLILTVDHNDQITLNWTDNSSDEDGFKVERYPSAGGAVWGEIADVNTPDTTSYQDSGLTPFTRYYYRVRAYRGSDYSYYSNQANAVTKVVNAPTGLILTVDSNTQITLNWTDTSSNEDGFKVERYPSAGGAVWGEIADVNTPDTTSYQDSGLTPFIRYYYRVRAYRGSDNSKYSNQAKAVTTMVDAPSNLAVTNVLVTRIDLSWTSNSSNEDGFKIERYPSAGGAVWGQIATVGAGVTTFSNLKLIQKKTYYYRVRAYKGSDNSKYSNQAKSTTLTNTTPAWDDEPGNIDITTNSRYKEEGKGCSNASDPDGPSSVLTDPGYLTCSLGGTTCSGFTPSVTGSGSNDASCCIFFRAPSTPATCTMTVDATDGLGAKISKTIDISVTESVVWFVDQSATAGNQTGDSWADAFLTVQEGVGAAAYGEEVWVADGDYYANTGADDAVLEMKDGVKVFGGFEGDEDYVSDRPDPISNSTILDAQDTNCHVVTANSLYYDQTLLDGFKIQNGNAQSSCSTNHGGGILANNVQYAYFKNLSLSNNYANYGGGISNTNDSTISMNYCNFNNNEAHYGGGMYNGNNSYPTISNSSFIVNVAYNYKYGSAYGRGGAVYNSSYSYPVISNSTFTYNYAGYSGGAIYQYGEYGLSAIDGSKFTHNSTNNGSGGAISSNSPLIITDSEFNDNTVGSYGRGGAIFQEDNYMTIRGSTFDKNEAYFGGAVYNNDSSSAINDSAFTYNSAKRGGAIFNYNGEGYNYRNVFSDNNANIGGAIVNAYSDEQSIRNSILEGNSASTVAGAIYNLGSSPEILNSTITGNGTTSTDGDDSGPGIFNEYYSYPTVMNSIVWGNTVSSGSPQDINGMDSSYAYVSYSDVGDYYGYGIWFPYYGAGNIYNDPLFVDAASKDFALDPASTCIDAGNADSVYNDQDDTRNDMGAYGGPFDFDGDGMPDWWEFFYGFNQLDPSDAAQDADSDGYTNLQEYTNATNPHFSWGGPI